MAETGHAHFDAALEARVVARRPLLYRGGADPSLDRPAHVRAGSALASWGDKLAVIQDDASFLAIIDAESGLTEAVAFPGSAVRQFDDTRGNKKDKLDLESAFVTPDGRLVALGSGSTSKRERILLARPGPTLAITLVDAPAFYAALRADRAFCGSELNVEGAALVGDDIVLFQRGNGAPRVIDGHAVEAVDATCRISLRELLAHLEEAAPVPSLRAVVPWRLGSTAGQATRLTFTDGARHPSGALAFLACAEDSPDVTRDGPVSAVTIGRLDDRTRTATLALVRDERGGPLLDKAEGLAFDASNRERAFVVTDRDDPTVPSELLELRLGAGW